MSLNNEAKSKIISEFSRYKNDTGSSEVQIALLTAKIKHLNNHFKEHKKDHHSRRGLLNMVAKRRRLQTYFKKKNITKYINLIDRLDIRR
ncbi:30S ribosomal protein S15 [Candidatus Providencia siddallii]|uniref:Small ribosomal subunit protein uS15 n=1 Tax=Candidatus Providencia siddallii TaxID=1715285 RepID=A0ABM9NPH1_9GAMM